MENMSDVTKSIIIVIGIIIFFLIVDSITKENEKKEKCVVKGNISYYGGQKIYHMPGDYYYNDTNPEYWFCTENEAKAAGFRRSKVR